MSTNKTDNRKAGKRRGVKSLIVALSAAATIGGWAMIAASQAPEAVGVSAIVTPTTAQTASAALQVQEASPAATPTATAQAPASAASSATPALRKVRAPKAQTVRRARPRPATVTRSSR